MKDAKLLNYWPIGIKESLESQCRHNEKVGYYNGIASSVIPKTLIDCLIDCLFRLETV